MSGRLAAVAVAAAFLAGCGDREPAAPPRVLAVTVPTAAARPDAGATAFAIGAGRAVTVAHVLRAGHAVRVGGRRAPVLRADRRLDVAVLAIGAGGGAVVRVGAAQAGDRVSVRVLRAGVARSLPATVRRVISARLRGFGVRPALELAAAVMPGDSGAPVLDARGRVVGVVFAEASDRDAIAYALDARALRPPLN